MVRKGRIGGSPADQKRYFDEVIAKYPDVVWNEGCAAPTVKDHYTHVKVKEKGKPVAMQPIPLLPYDHLMVEYHMWETYAFGKCGRSIL